MARKLPAFQFYPGDWMKEPSLRCISHASKGVYVDMLCLAFECEDRGVLATGGTPWRDEQIAAAVGGPQDATLACIAELLAMGVVSRNQSGAIFSRRMVRDENERKQTAGRVRKHRNGGSNISCNETVTPKYEGEDEDEASKKRKKDDDEFERFWATYPRGRKKSKGAARKAWVKAVVIESPEVIIAAAGHYAKTPEGKGQYVKMPSTWLNNECWNDDRAAWDMGRSDEDRAKEVRRQEQEWASRQNAALRADRERAERERQDELNGQILDADRINRA